MKYGIRVSLFHNNLECDDVLAPYVRLVASVYSKALCGISVDREICMSEEWSKRKQG